MNLTIVPPRSSRIKLKEVRSYAGLDAKRGVELLSRGKGWEGKISELGP